MVGNPPKWGRVLAFWSAQAREAAPLICRELLGRVVPLPFCGSRHGEPHCHRLSGEDLVVGVDQIDLHLVLAGRKPAYVDCIVVTRIRPRPGQVVDVDVEMPDAWGYAEGARPERL